MGSPLPLSRKTSHENIREEIEAMFGLHGKTISGSMTMGDCIYALEFTDGTHLWLQSKTPINIDLRNEPL